MLKVSSLPTFRFLLLPLHSLLPLPILSFSSLPSFSLSFTLSLLYSPYSLSLYSPFYTPHIPSPFTLPSILPIYPLLLLSLYSPCTLPVLSLYSPFTLSLLYSPFTLPLLSPFYTLLIPSPFTLSPLYSPYSLSFYSLPIFSLLMLFLVQACRYTFLHTSFYLHLSLNCWRPKLTCLLPTIIQILDGTFSEAESLLHAQCSLILFGVVRVESSSVQRISYSFPTLSPETVVDTIQGRAAVLGEILYTLLFSHVSNPALVADGPGDTANADRNRRRARAGLLLDCLRTFVLPTVPCLPDFPNFAASLESQAMQDAVVTLSSVCLHHSSPRALAHVLPHFCSAKLESAANFLSKGLSSNNNVLASCSTARDSPANQIVLLVLDLLRGWGCIPYGWRTHVHACSILHVGAGESLAPVLPHLSLPIRLELIPFLVKVILAELQSKEEEGDVEERDQKEKGVVAKHSTGSIQRGRLAVELVCKVRGNMPSFQYLD